MWEQRNRKKKKTIWKIRCHFDSTAQERMLVLYRIYESSDGDLFMFIWRNENAESGKYIPTHYIYIVYNIEGYKKIERVLIYIHSNKFLYTIVICNFLSNLFYSL